MGVSIMVIGLSGIAEAREWSREHDDGPTESNAHHDMEVILESDREQSVRLPPVYLHKRCAYYGHTDAALSSLKLLSLSLSLSLALSLSTLLSLSL